MKQHVEFDLEFKKNPYPGKFIVLEGIEASGKTTQAKVLEEKFPDAFHTKNPTGTNEIGVFIREKILGGKTDIPPVAYQYLFAADREIDQRKVIESLKAGKMVISDRYFWSSVAYGISDREGTDYENQEELYLVSLSLLSMYHKFLIPDLTIYLDVTLEESLKRLGGSTKHTEIYDNHETNVKVKKGYEWLIKKFPEEFSIVDANSSEEEVTSEVLKLIERMNA